MEWVVGRDDEGAVARAFFSSVVPRPIGLISTLGIGGVVNVAPYAFSGAVCHAPPMVSVAPGLRAGRLKDTAANVLRDGEFVYHVVTADLVEQAVRAGEAFAADRSEAELIGFPLLDATDVKPPRIASAKVAMECRLWDSLELPDGRPLLLGTVTRIHASDDVVVDGAIDDRRLKAVGRLGGTWFTTADQPFALPFPARI